MTGKSCSRPAFVSQQGFSFFELLLALAIFATAAGSLLTVVAQSARNITSIEEMTFASWVANNRMVELHHEDTWPPKDKAKGEIEMAGLTWYWQQRVVEAEYPLLREVTVVVYTDKEMQQQAYQLATYVSKSGVGNVKLN